MSLSIVQSIHPKYCELIASGKKTIEVRKTKPRIPTPFKAYIYQTRHPWVYNIFTRFLLPQGKVIGEYVCDEVFSYEDSYIDIPKNEVDNMCLSYGELYEYGNGKNLYGYHISNLKIYDQPKELSEFRKPCIYGNFPHACDFCDWGEEEVIEIPPNDCGYDGQAHLYVCTNILTRAPQSWCYVEEIE